MDRISIRRSRTFIGSAPVSKPWEIWARLSTFGALALVLAFAGACGGDDDDDDASGGAGGEDTSSGGAGGGLGGAGGGADDDDDDDDDSAGGAGGSDMPAGGSGGSGDDPAVDPNCPGKDKEVTINPGDNYKNAIRDLDGGEVVTLGAGNHSDFEIKKEFKCETTFTGPGVLVDVTITESKNVTLDGLTFTEGLVNVDKSEVVVVKGLKVKNAGYCVIVRNSKDILVEGSSCESTRFPDLDFVADPGAGMQVIGRSENVRFIGNRVTGPGWPDTIDTSHEQAFAIVGGAPTVSPKDVLIANNIVDNIYLGLSIDGVNGLDVVNNTMRRTYLSIRESWLEINGNIFNQSQDLRIFNNVFENGSGQFPYRLKWTEDGRTPFQRASDKIAAPTLVTNNYFNQTRGRNAPQGIGGSGDNALTGGTGLNGDLVPGGGSKLIDAGFEDPAVPETDINGKMRSGKPDIGAVES